MTGFGNKGKWRFQRVRLTESTDQLSNPSCGWCRIYTVSPDQPVDLEELYWSLRENETLVQVMILIGAYKNQQLSQQALLRLEQLFRFFADHKKEMIVRFAYDNIGQGLLAEPEQFAQVLTHMQQTGPLLRLFAEDILVLQGLFVGSWGELHSSRYLSKEKLITLSATLREAIGKKIPIAVRTPLQWRLLHLQDTILQDTDMCMFNDGMFGSASDLGTYGVKNRKDADWEESWNREDELAFIGQIHKHLPYGGEAVGTKDEGSLKNAVRQMRQTHVRYLNAVHDQACMERWKQEICKEKGIWKGRNGLDYISAHLGIRPVIRKVSGRVQDGLHLDIEIENTGFAGLLEEAELVISAEAEGRQSQSICLPLLPQDFMPGMRCKKNCQFAKEMESGRYRVCVQMRRKRDRRQICMANEPDHVKVLAGLFHNL